MILHIHTHIYLNRAVKCNSVFSSVNSPKFYILQYVCISVLEIIASGIVLYKFSRFKKKIQNTESLSSCSKLIKTWPPDLFCWPVEWICFSAVQTSVKPFGYVHYSLIILVYQTGKDRLGENEINRGTNCQNVPFFVRLIHAKICNESYDRIEFCLLYMIRSQRQKSIKKPSIRKYSVLHFVHLWTANVCKVVKCFK